MIRQIGVDFGRNHAARYHERSQNRTQLTNQRQGNEIPKLIDGAVRRQRGIGLQRQHAARKKSGQDNDGQRTDTDPVHLLDGLRNVAGTPNNPTSSPRRQQGHVLQFEQSPGRDVHSRISKRVCGLGKLLVAKVFNVSTAEDQALTGGRKSCYLAQKS